MLNKNVKSTLKIRPTLNRNSPTNTSEQWLKDRQKLDGAENLWRIHDNLYDLSDFIKIHPGGSQWLEFTQGIDITEAYETHHTRNQPDQILAKYFTRKAKSPRNNPFTFEEDGFYKTLRKEVRQQLSENNPKQPINTSKFFTECLLVATFLFAILANAYRNYWLGVLSAVAMSYTAVCAHNYFHQKDNHRMYYVNFTFMPVREYRIIHVLSHHLYTNTIGDLQISLFEPLMIHYMSYEKTWFTRFGVLLYFPFLWAVTFHLNLYALLSQVIRSGMTKVVPSDFIGFLLPLAMYVFGGESLWQTFWMWNFILLASGFHYGLVGETAAHHHPDIFHDGDTPRTDTNYDWGIFQLDAVMDKSDVTGSHFMVLTNFGDHALHHMFPTLDHGTLEHLYPTFRKVMADFNVELRMSNQYVMITGLFQQLAKILPNPLPPNLFKKYVK